MNTIAALIMGAAAAALVTALLGLAIIPWLRKLHFGQTILEIGPKWHEKKQGTPEQRGDERRGRRAHYQCCDSVHCFFLPVSCGSPRIFLTVSRSSSGNFSPPIS